MFAKTRRRRDQSLPIERAMSPPRPRSEDLACAISLGWPPGVVGRFVLSAILVLLVPRFSRRAADTVRYAPIASPVGGFVTLIVVAIAAVLVFALGIAIGVWWIGLVVLAMYGVALALALTVAALFAGTLIGERAWKIVVHPVLALLLGVALLLLIGLVPVVGGVVVFGARRYGLGALPIAAFRAHGGETIWKKLSILREPTPTAE